MSTNNNNNNNNKKNLLKALCNADIIGCACGKSNKLPNVYEPIPINPRKASQNPKPSTTAAAREATATSTTTMEEDQDYAINASKVLSPCPKIVDSLAVVKDSNDPYEDFRNSMLQMIVEKEIYSKDDLKELLKCFLELNSPCHHDLIVQAFTGIWNDEAVPNNRPDHLQSHES